MTEVYRSRRAFARGFKTNNRIIILAPQPAAHRAARIARIERRSFRSAHCSVARLVSLRASTARAVVRIIALALHRVPLSSLFARNASFRFAHRLTRIELRSLRLHRSHASARLASLAQLHCSPVTHRSLGSSLGSQALVIVDRLALRAPLAPSAASLRSLRSHRVAPSARLCSARLHRSPLRSARRIGSYLRSTVAPFGSSLIDRFALRAPLAPPALKSCYLRSARIGRIIALALHRAPLSLPATHRVSPAPSFHSRSLGSSLIAHRPFRSSRFARAAARIARIELRSLARRRSHLQRGSSFIARL